MAGAEAEGDDLLEAAQDAAAHGDTRTAGRLFQQLLAEDPAQPEAIGGLARCLIAERKFADARQLLDGAPKEAAGHAGGQRRARRPWRWPRRRASSATRPTLQARLEADADDHDARYRLATVMFLRGQAEAAMEHLLQIVRRDRDLGGRPGAQAAGQVLRRAGPQAPGDAEGPADAVLGAVQLSRPMRELASSLPSRFPVFPLRGALLLPGGNLPLNIFEPRYLQMVRDAMQTDRVIGMIQPQGRRRRTAPCPQLYRTGCAGRITNFSETDDGRFLITLTGVCRFDVAEELDVDTLYRQVVGRLRAAGAATSSRRRRRPS